MLTPSYQDDWLTIYGGDCRTVLAELPAESVHCVVTSPPYWGLRDYGVTDQLGLEPTPEQYVENMVAVFREIRHVLRSDGTVWLNLGDSYANNGPGSWGSSDKSTLTTGSRNGAWAPGNTVGKTPARQSGLKPKDLVGIPWRVAFALQADGWYLRSDIIWSKPNPMPESVTDRPTKSHEYLFLLAKSSRYYFDADAVRESNTTDGESWRTTSIRRRQSKVDDSRGDTDRMTVGEPATWTNPAGRNIRTVWTVATQPYPGAHFAVFPEKLIEPCILAGTSERGVCPECGKPWRRVTETSRPGAVVRHTLGDKARNIGQQQARPDRTYEEGFGSSFPRVSSRTLSWIPSCAHGGEPVGAVVLDPFGGSGTTARVANRLSRRAVLIDLNPDYLKQQMNRNRDLPLGLGA